MSNFTALLLNHSVHNYELTKYNLQQIKCCYSGGVCGFDVAAQRRVAGSDQLLPTVAVSIVLIASSQLIVRLSSATDNSVVCSLLIIALGLSSPLSPQH